MPPVQHEPKRRHGLGQVKAGRDVAAGTLADRLADIFEIFTIREQHQGDVRKVLRQSIDATEHVWRDDASLADAKKD